MFIAESILVLIVAAPLILGGVIGFSLGRIGMLTICNKVDGLKLSIESLAKNVKDTKNTPLFPVQNLAPAVLL